MKKIFIVILMCLCLMGCNQKDNVVDVFNLLDNQKIVNNHKLIDYGYNKEGRIILNYKIGEIKNAFIGYLTSPQYNDGSSTSTISYTKLESSKEITEWSIKNIEIVTKESYINENLTIGYKDYVSLSIDMGFSIKTEAIEESNYGKKYEKMLEEIDSKSFTIGSNCSEGYYSIAALTNYTIIQNVIYDLNTNEIVESNISFLQSSYKTDTFVCLVKADKTEDFKYVFKNIKDRINTINDVSKEDLNEVISYFKKNISKNYTFITGNEIILSDGNKNNYTSYKRLDCLSDIILSHKNFNLMKNLYDTMNIHVKFDIENAAIKKMDMKFKIVNQTTKEQIGEIIVDLEKSEYSCIIDLNKINSNDIVDLEYCFKLKGTFAALKYVIYENREYTIMFE